MTKDEMRTLAEEAKARAAEATPGPWWRVRLGNGNECIMSDDIAITEGIIRGEVLQRDDADFMAAARQDVPALADAVLALLDENARIRKAVSDAAVSLAVSLLEDRKCEKAALPKEGGPSAVAATEEQPR